MTEPVIYVSTGPGLIAALAAFQHTRLGAGALTEPSGCFLLREKTGMGGDKPLAATAAGLRLPVLKGQGLFR